MKDAYLPKNLRKRQEYKRILADMFQSRLPYWYRENPDSYFPFWSLPFEGWFVHLNENLNPEICFPEIEEGHYYGPSRDYGAVLWEKNFQREGYLPLQDHLAVISASGSLSYSPWVRNALLGHEIAHLLLEEYEERHGKKLEESCDRNFVDSVGARLILPDLVLEYVYSDRFCPNIVKETPLWFREISRRYLVSTENIILRINEAKSEGVVDPNKFMFTISYKGDDQEIQSSDNWVITAYCSPSPYSFDVSKSQNIERIENLLDITHRKGIYLSLDDMPHLMGHVIPYIYRCTSKVFESIDDPEILYRFASFNDQVNIYSEKGQETLEKEWQVTVLPHFSFSKLLVTEKEFSQRKDTGQKTFPRVVQLKLF